MAEREIQRAGEEIERLIGEVESLADPALRSSVLDLIRSVLDLHATAFARVLEIAAEKNGRSLLDALAADDLVGSILILYDLHPSSMEERARHAVERLEADLKISGIRLALLDVRDGVARVRIQVSTAACGAGAADLRTVIEDAVLGAAPELRSVELEQAGGLGREQLVQLKL